ncbi:hypothetical protein LTS01_025915, partial [Friedmanniomyces endolithicus]
RQEGEEEGYPRRIRQEPGWIDQIGLPGHRVRDGRDLRARRGPPPRSPHARREVAQDAANRRRLPRPARLGPRLFPRQGKVLRAEERQPHHTSDRDAGPPRQGRQHLLHAGARVVRLALPRARAD